MNKNEKGDWCELEVIQKFLRQGCPVAIPFGNQSGWDLLVECGGKWLKVQVKCAYRRSKRGSMYVDCIRSGDPRMKNRSRKYKKGDFDVLIAVEHPIGRTWWIDAECVIGRRAMTLNYDNAW